MCADIHDGREKTLPSKGRTQMSQTNYLQIVTPGLQRTAGPYRSAISDTLKRKRVPLRPQYTPISFSPAITNTTPSAFKIIGT